jgi:hypothetical protein
MISRNRLTRAKPDGAKVARTVVDGLPSRLFARNSQQNRQIMKLERLMT